MVGSGSFEALTSSVFSKGVTIATGSTVGVTAAGSSDTFGVGVSTSFSRVSSFGSDVADTDTLLVGIFSIKAKAA